MAEAEPSLTLEDLVDKFEYDLTTQIMPSDERARASKASSIGHSVLCLISRYCF